MVRFLALTLSAVCFGLPAAAQSAGAGYWRTNGNRIVDANGTQVRISGVNWNGFESGNYVVHGLWGGLNRTWKSHLQQMASLGFNLIRLPFSGDVLAPGRMPQNIDFGVNPDLQGKTSLEIMDLIVAECGRLGIRIILDYHRVQAGFTPENGLWYVPGSGTHTETLWINHWKTIAGRYAGNPTVVGVDLFNEVHADGSHPGPFWSADGVNEPFNWRTAAKRCAEAIFTVNPDVLVCVQGMHGYGSETSWWGANLMGLRDHPFNVSRPNQVVYQIHDYGPNVWNQPWHNDPNFPTNLPAFWDRQWGFVHTENIGPIWIGEWGSKLDIPKEVQWATALRDYIRTKGLSWTWWTWTPNSGDTGGILTDNWTTTEQAKLDLIASVLYPGFAPSGGGTPPPPPPGTTPVGGVPRAVPGTIEAEDFDDGGEGAAYHDTTPGNAGTQYRTTDVDVEVTSDAGGGYNVGWLAPGEWLAFTVDVTSAGTYRLDARVASALSGGTFHVESGGADLTGPIVAPATGGWQTWTTVGADGVTLAAGVQALRVVFDAGSFNVNSLTLTLVSAGGGPGTQPPTPPPGSASGGGSEGSEGCGATGAELLILLAVRRLRRRRT